MIKVNKQNIEIEGKENIICAELGMIFNSLYEQIGEKRTKQMIKIAIDTVCEENKKDYAKVHFIKKKELKNKLKQDLPEELAKILSELL